MKKLLLSLFLFTSSLAFSQMPEETKSLNRIGTELDVLPFATGGYYFSAWYGWSKNQTRIRPVIAKVNVPDFAVDKNFQNNKIFAVALIADYFLKPEFEGFWIGSGFEYWQNSIENKSSITADYNAFVFTLGGGYVWKFYEDFYVNPWVASHVLIGGDKEIKVGLETFKPQLFTFEGSIKLGWSF